MDLKGKIEELKNIPRKKLIMIGGGTVGVLLVAFLAMKLLGKPHSKVAHDEHAIHAEGEKSEEHPQNHEEASGHEGEESSEHATDHATEKPHGNEKSTKHDEHKNEKGHGLFKEIKTALQSIQDKTYDLKQLDLDNHKLRAENGALREWIENKKFECLEDKSLKKTENSKYQLEAETGSGIGRTLSSMEYRIPKNLSNEQLYILGVSYFKAKEMEKAAVIFTYLTSFQSKEVFKNPQNYIMTGISWYHLDHFKHAESYFGMALKFDSTKENQKYFAQARLWRALTSKSLEDQKQTQFWLRELLSYHPHSQEAQWINSREGDYRAPSQE